MMAWSGLVATTLNRSPSLNVADSPFCSVRGSLPNARSISVGLLAPPAVVTLTAESWTDNVHCSLQGRKRHGCICGGHGRSPRLMCPSNGRQLVHYLLTNRASGH